ncbi:Fic family protein [Thiotrichales bacterium 19S3-7]|nr:Fic family protein [Thiotrichales bacterium 19S3-7]MCF6802986.1 Fic family protein [Thiotrichales bacterium 19S3-11]
MTFPKNYNVFLFTDLKKHQFDELLQRFEEREPGYFDSLLFTFNKTRNILRKSKFLTQDLLKTIHYDAMNGVKYTNYELYESVKEKLDEYTVDGNNFSIRSNEYTSIEGLKEWYNQQKTLWADCFFYDGTVSPRSKISSEEELIRVFNAGNLNVHNGSINLDDDIQDILNHYNTQIQKSLAKHEKLELICKTAQRLERRHPFTDGNGRTFSMILLNTLLEQSGFHFALQADPNRIDGLSLNQLVSEIEYSMKKTEIFENLYSKNPEIGNLFIRLCSKCDHEIQLSPGINPGLYLLNDLEKMANLYYENDINTVMPRFYFDDQFIEKRREIETLLVQNVIDKISSVVTQYKSKDKASFFNWQLFHHHGRTGATRADKLQEIIDKVNPKKPDTLADLHIFIYTFLNPEYKVDKRSLYFGDLPNEDEQLLSGGNNTRSSLKFLLSNALSSEQQNTHDYLFYDSQLKYIDPMIEEYNDRNLL